MHVGILGGTGPAGRGLASRLGAAGVPVTLGSRDGARASAVAADDPRLRTVMKTVTNINSDITTPDIRM